jgi:predicted nucleic acid-binding protein
MLLFLDANILFSAAHRESGSVRIFFRLADAGLCELVSSSFAIDEARRNVARKYSGRSADLERLIAKLGVCAEATPERIEWGLAQKLPAKEAPILAAAVQSGAAVLVTGDHRDFGHLFDTAPGGTRVLSPAAAIEWLLDRMA